MTCETYSIPSCRKSSSKENSIQVMIRRSDLRELLENGGRIVAPNLMGVRKPIEPAELICLTIEAKRKQ